MVKNKYFLVTVAFLVWIFFLDTNNLIVWYRDLRQLADQNRQKVYFQNEIKQTEEKLKELTSNKDSLEKFAREEYLFHEAGEDIYVIEDSK
ncbi:MAG: septum formation initiator family protein [Bacteroidales bacterium]|nr:septum formation initiator family protein [Bacteroidales bacterium]